MVHNDENDDHEVASIKRLNLLSAIPEEDDENVNSHLIGGASSQLNAPFLNREASNNVNYSEVSSSVVS